MEFISGKFTIKQIFKDHWNNVLSLHKTEIPDFVITTVNKMLSCRDPEKLGYSKFACPDHPNEITIVPHSCKSKFCNTCGNLQTERWINESSSLFPNAIYYHITLTIPDLLWYFLEGNWPLVNLLFKASGKTVLSWFKEHNIIPAICSALHSFGKDIKVNYHIHLIVTAGGIHCTKKKGPSWKSINFIPYKKMLKTRWRAILMEYLKPYLNPNLKELLYSINWYVHVNMRVLDLSSMRRYIGRYAKKPVIAETRITNYDGKTVTFFYKERDNPNLVYVTLTAKEFILKLIKHITPPQFKIIRYYGLLANSVKKKYKETLLKVLKQVKRVVFYLKWRTRQIRFKGIDPLLCPICGKEKILKEFAYFSSSSGGLAYKFF